MSGSYSVVVYDWAGYYRSVNMGKAEFHFAEEHHIPNLMKTFEKKFLSVYMLCTEMDKEMHWLRYILN